MEPEYQLTAGQISEQTYVDDVMGGAETVSAALKQTEDSAAICVAARMRLRKWKTNSAELRVALDPEGNESTANGVLSQVIAGDVTTKALGLQWETDDDSFVFNPSAIIRQANELKKAPTKRDILKISARIFDPLGLISAVVLQLKWHWFVLAHQRSTRLYNSSGFLIIRSGKRSRLCPCLRRFVHLLAQHTDGHRLR